MKIKGRLFLTIHAVAGVVYEIDYTTSPKLSVLNCTGDKILISDDIEFTDNGDIGNYITLPAGAAANCTPFPIAFPFPGIYIKAAADGDIVIERCG